jgi:hypothetical protein
MDLIIKKSLGRQLLLTETATTIYIMGKAGIIAAQLS